MRTGRAGPHLFTSSDEDSEEDAPEGRRARVSDPWLAPSSCHGGARPCVGGVH